MKEKRFITALIVMILILSSAVIGAGISSSRSIEKTVHTQRADNSGNELNMTLYRSLTNLNLTRQPSEIHLQTGQQGDGKINIKNFQGEEFKVKLILTNVEWMPDFEGQQRSSKIIQEEIKFYDSWFKKLENETSNIYTLKYDQVKYNETDLEKTISFSISVERGGNFHVVPLIKPVNQSCWMMHLGSVNINVERPGNFVYKYAYMIYPIVIVAVFCYATYRIKYKLI